MISLRTAFLTALLGLPWVFGSANADERPDKTASVGNVRLAISASNSTLVQFSVTNLTDKLLSGVVVDCAVLTPDGAIFGDDEGFAQNVAPRETAYSHAMLLGRTAPAGSTAKCRVVRITD